MSNYIRDIKKQNTWLRRRHKSLLKEIEGLKKLFKKTHKERPEYKSFDIEIDMTQVTAKTRKLKTTWSIEAVDDFNGFQDIQDILNDAVQKEIDNEVTEQISKEAEQIGYKKKYRKNSRRRK